jgi:hypothetical protein
MIGFQFELDVCFSSSPKECDEITRVKKFPLNLCSLCLELWRGEGTIFLEIFDLFSHDAFLGLRTGGCAGQEKQPKLKVGIEMRPINEKVATFHDLGKGKYSRNPR